MSKLDHIEDFNIEENTLENAQQESNEQAADNEANGNKSAKANNTQEDVPVAIEEKTAKETTHGKKKTIFGWGIYGAILIAIYITFHFFLLLSSTLYTSIIIR